MILRDRVTIKDHNGATVAEGVRAHVSHQTATLPSELETWTMIEQATAIVPAGTPWGHGQRAHTLTVEGPGGVEYGADGPPIPRRRAGAVHHLTLPLKRRVSG